MKQSDIFTLILIAGIGTLAAFFVCQTLLGDPDQAKVEFKTIRTMASSELTAPDPEVFNSTAINPTVEVYVGDCEDRDKNGILDENEVRWCECANYDADSDGTISDEEYTTCQSGQMNAGDNPENEDENPEE